MFQTTNRREVEGVGGMSTTIMNVKEAVLKRTDKEIIEIING